MGVIKIQDDAEPRVWAYAKCACVNVRMPTWTCVCVRERTCLWVYDKESSGVIILTALLARYLQFQWLAPLNQINKTTMAYNGSHSAHLLRWLCLRHATDSFARVVHSNVNISFADHVVRSSNLRCYYICPMGCVRLVDIALQPLPSLTHNALQPQVRITS